MADGGFGFPVEPFDPKRLPGPDEADPIHRLAYRNALTGADAYRLTRAAVRREEQTLRVGNRFVSLSRYREIAFLALGRAAISQALAVTEALGGRLTQGFVASPDPLPTEVPFRWTTQPALGPGHPAAAEVAGVAADLARGLGTADLLLLLLSPGALGYLALPPEKMGREAWLAQLHSLTERGLTAGELDAYVRLTAAGPVGGRLPTGVEADIVTLLVSRGDPAETLGGGPTIPISVDERRATRAALDRVGAWGQIPAAEQAALSAGPGGPIGRPRNVRRPVLIAEPADALRDASESVGEKQWLPRLAELRNTLPPAPAADRFLERIEALAGDAPDPAYRGYVVFGPMTLDLSEGVDERPAMGEFLRRASLGLRRRGVTIGIARTCGAPPSDRVPPGAVVSASTDPGSAARARSVPLRAAITDVGLLATAVVPYGKPT